jgi:hypothetical protein
MSEKFGPSPEELGISEPTEKSQVTEIQKEKDAIRENAIAQKKLVYSEAGKFEYGLAPNGEHSNLIEKQWLEVRTSEFKNWFGDWERFAELSQNEERSAQEQVEYQDLEPRVSKMVDRNGEPAVFWHGTGKEFNEFLQVKRTNYYSGHYFADRAEKVLDYAGLGRAAWAKPEEHKLAFQESRESALRQAEHFKEKYKKTLFFFLKPLYLNMYKGWRRTARKIQPRLIPAYLKATKPLFIDNMNDVIPDASEYEDHAEVDPGTKRDGSWGVFEDDIRFAAARGYDAVVWHNTYDGTGPLGTVLNVFNGRQIKSAEKNDGRFSTATGNIYE